MGKSFDGDSAFTEAHKVYVTETAQHLVEAKKVFLTDEVLSEEELYKMMARFHTIKGGAGFFGFTEIAKVSGELEKLFQLAPDEVQKKMKFIQELIEKLEKLTE